MFELPKKVKQSRTCAEADGLMRPRLCTSKKEEACDASGFAELSYIPAKDVARRARFTSEKLGFKAKKEINGGVVMSSRRARRVSCIPRQMPGTSKASQLFWDVKRRRSRSGGTEGRGVTVREVRHAGHRCERHHHGRRGKGGMVQGFGRQYHGDHPDAVIR